MILLLGTTINQNK